MKRISPKQCNPWRIGLIVLLVSLSFCLASPWPSHAAAPNPPSIADQLVGGEFSYVIQSGDSLTAISARFGVGVRV